MLNRTKIKYFFLESTKNMSLKKNIGKLIYIVLDEQLV